MLQQFARCTIPSLMLFELGIFIPSPSIHRLESFSPTGNDEMCNFYMMYWVDGDQLLEENVCASRGPPYYYFAEDPVSSLTFSLK